MKRELRQLYQNPPTMGVASMIVEAYRNESMQDCPNCKSNKHVVAYNPGRKGFTDAVHRFKCTECEYLF